MQLIWFNPEQRSYHTGGEVDYQVQLSLSEQKADFFVLDKLEDIEIKVAYKIVDRLNKAYALYEI